MERYYFHIRTTTGLDVDEIGVDCRSLDDAKQQAVGFARVVWELLAHDKLAGCEAFEIADETGSIVTIIPLMAARVLH
ncbi:DUF6894 family protein [Pseudorhizobium flavum]|uniref:DUF6894 family protein n=1 Tax=Pseudorhizobium flavum TaxID=1335061 RepID=UPI00376F6AF9